LSNFVKFIEGNKLFLKVLSVEIVKIVEPKYFVIFQSLCQEVSDLSWIELAFLQHLGCFLGCAFEINLFMLHHIDSRLEKAIFLMGTNNFLFDLQLRRVFSNYLRQNVKVFVILMGWDFENLSLVLSFRLRIGTDTVREVLSSLSLSLLGFLVNCFFL